MAFTSRSMSSIVKTYTQVDQCFLVVIVSLNRGELVGIQSSARFAHEDVFLREVLPGFQIACPFSCTWALFSRQLRSPCSVHVHHYSSRRSQGALLPVRRFECSWEKSNNVGVMFLSPA